MSDQLTTANVKQYRDSVTMLAQQMKSRLRGKVRLESQVGEAAFWDQIGETSMQEAKTRFDDTPLIDIPHGRRQVVLRDFRHAEAIDKKDKRRLLLDPKGRYQQAQSAALGRQYDDIILEAASADAKTGQEGGTTTSLPNSQKIVPVSGGAGVNANVDALRRAKQKFGEADIDPDVRLYCAINPSGIRSLLEETETTSSDFNTVRALVEGKIDEFLGFTFIVTNRLNTQSGTLSFDTSDGSVGSGGGDADTYVKAIFWAEDGILLSEPPEGPMARVDERSDKNYIEQVYLSHAMGGVRMEEVKVVEMLMNQS